VTTLVVGEALNSAAQPSQQEDGDDDDFGDFGVASSVSEISVSKNRGRRMIMLATLVQLLHKMTKTRTSVTLQPRGS
jgi:hypothetical protein